MEVTVNEGVLDKENHSAVFFRENHGSYLITPGPVNNANFYDKIFNSSIIHGKRKIFNNG